MESLNAYIERIAFVANRNRYERLKFDVIDDKSTSGNNYAIERKFRVIVSGVG